MKKRIIVGSLLVAIIGGFVYAFSNSDSYEASIATMGLNFVSKGMCSCLWVSEQPEDFCIDYARVEQVNPSIEVNYTDRSVTTKLFWIFSSTTRFVNPEVGCQIEVESPQLSASAETHP